MGGGPGGPMGMRPGGQFGGGGPGGPGGFAPQRAPPDMMMRAQQMQNQQMQQRSQAALAAGGAPQQQRPGGAGGGGGGGGAGGAAGGKLTESQQEILAMEAKEKALQKKAKQWSALAGEAGWARGGGPGAALLGSGGGRWARPASAPAGRVVWVWLEVRGVRARGVGVGVMM